MIANNGVDANVGMIAKYNGTIAYDSMIGNNGMIANECIIASNGMIANDDVITNNNNITTYDGMIANTCKSYSGK